MTLKNCIQTLCQCHICGYSWKLKYSTIKKIIMAKRNNDILKRGHKHGDVDAHAYLCKECPECETNVCVYSDNIEDYDEFIPKRKLITRLKCLIEGHDFKGNLRHSIYTCKKCNVKIKYKNAKIEYLN